MVGIKSRVRTKGCENGPILGIRALHDTEGDPNFHFSPHSRVLPSFGRFSLILENLRFWFFKAMCENHLGSFFIYK
jgi:hypothetical protein